MIAAVGCIVSKQSLFICKKRTAVSAGNFGADVFAVVAGVMPLNAVSGLNFIIAAAVIRINSVHTVHPAAALTAVKFVKVVDSFNVCAVENRGIAGFHMDLPVSCFAAENIENSLAVVKGHGCFFQYYSVGRKHGKFIGVEHLDVLQYRAALDEHCAGLPVFGGGNIRTPGEHDCADKRKHRKQQSENTPTAARIFPFNKG